MFDIPGYKIGDKIGEGGSSEVFLATRLENKQNAALKVLHAKYSSDRSMRERLEREAKVVGSLNHPNIVKFFKYGAINNRFYMLLEYLAKGSLSDYERLSYRQRLKVMIQVCDGVSHIHKLGIVHRDLKPSNIMFGDDRIPRLVDFGISLFSQEDYTRLTQTNMVMGTLSYMSPEQQSNPGAVDFRTDIYSLGAILYEIFTGRKPVGRFDDPSRLIPKFNLELETCILTCLAHQPEKRYSEMSQLTTALVDLWRSGLFSETEGEQVEEHFDDRIGYWVQKLTHGIASERVEARNRIMANVLPKDLEELIKICRNSGAEVRAALIPAMGKLKRPAAGPFLCEQMTDPLLAREACAALGQIGHKNAIEPLLKVAKKREVYSYSALVPLAMVGEDKHLKVALPYLKSKSYSERKEAIKALELSGSTKYLKDLKKALKVEAETDLRNQLYNLVQRLEVQ